MNLLLQEHCFRPGVWLSQCPRMLRKVKLLRNYCQADGKGGGKTFLGACTMLCTLDWSGRRSTYSQSEQYIIFQITLLICTVPVLRASSVNVTESLGQVAAGWPEEALEWPIFPVIFKNAFQMYVSTVRFHVNIVATREMTGGLRKSANWDGRKTRQ